MWPNHCHHVNPGNAFVYKNLLCIKLWEPKGKERATHQKVVTAFQVSHTLPCTASFGFALCLWAKDNYLCKKGKKEKHMFWLGLPALTPCEHFFCFPASLPLGLLSPVRGSAELVPKWGQLAGGQARKHSPPTAKGLCSTAPIFVLHTATADKPWSRDAQHSAKGSTQHMVAKAFPQQGALHLGLSCYSPLRVSSEDYSSQTRKSTEFASLCS